MMLCMDCRKVMERHHQHTITMHGQKRTVAVYRCPACGKEAGIVETPEPDFLKDFFSGIRAMRP
jgi:RNase P subunit RPR2